MPYGKCYKCGKPDCSNDCDIPENDIDGHHWKDCYNKDCDAFHYRDEFENAGQFTMECPGGSKCECDYYNESE